MALAGPEHAALSGGRDTRTRSGTAEPGSDPGSLSAMNDPPATTVPSCDPARSFGRVAAAYDRGRPSYSTAAVDWALGPVACSVLDVGAGTGKLTTQLVAAGHDVQALEPDPQMLAVLRERVPEARPLFGVAEDLPIPDACVDIVVCAQSFHWLDHDRALPEFARVLRPSGRLVVIRNDRDDKIPWVRRLSRLLGPGHDPLQAATTLTGSPHFDLVETHAAGHWHAVNRDTLLDLARSQSTVSALDEPEQARRLAEIAALYDEYGRGMDGMRLPYRTTCVRARPVHVEPLQPDGDRDDDTDDEILLIDFR